jgi:hypothetical protein
MSARIPPEAAAAAARGELIEAIKLTRQATGLGLKEAKDLVDRHQAGAARSGDTGFDAPEPATARRAPRTARQAAARRPGLAPGEVPRSRWPTLGWLLLAAAALALWWWR